MNYAKLREQIYGPLREQGAFSWDFLYGQEYALALPGVLVEKDRYELSYATERLGAIFAKTVSAVQRGSNKLLLELGIPRETFDAVKLPIMSTMPTMIGRFDFTKTTAGWKMLEFNADTPGGVVEAFCVNEHVCRFYSVQNPNQGCEINITEAFSQAISIYRELGYPVKEIVFSAPEWHAEDAGTAQYLLQVSRLNAFFTALKDLRVYRDRLCASVNGELIPVDVWHRLHPFGILCGEADTDGYPTGAHVLDIIARKRLAVLNPASSLIAQTKALQALIWNLYEAGEFFTRSEREAIGSYMLPTYLENRFQGISSYVTKPVLGREGGGISIYDADGQLLHQSCDQSFMDQRIVFQKFIEMEEVTVETLGGQCRGFAVWGSFLIGGKASAINVRVGGRITDDMSYYCPIMGCAEFRDIRREKDGETVG